MVWTHKQELLIVTGAQLSDDPAVRLGFVPSGACCAFTHERVRDIVTTVSMLQDGRKTNV